ncbi:MAG TPA: GntR family transcriptional regulator [Bradyrhizobium sp.]|uniref:GntR family transcriptional regulator n=1 Tax=Bradyrhizobium sp. TaxID=376 RepID=UPI002CFFBF4F|nr:GntR family transcriptional regulator [Bradyrhizobium sp.]HLZ03410.1 GntR family transcriptional regulator [Bradyrhizobium sp.]
MDSIGSIARRGRRAGGSKVDQAYFALKRAIVSGSLAPETSIDKNEWCATFDVSRLSITTAINRLAFEGLVLVEPQRGSYVARIHLEDVRQWMLMRRALEIEVVAACAADMSERAIEALGQNLAYQKAAISSGDLEGFHEFDTRFHRQMTEGRNLARLGEVLDPIRTHLERVRRTLLPEPGRPEGTFREHEAIYHAIAAREPARAKHEMANHLDRVSRELQAFVAKHPGFFDE